MASVRPFGLQPSRAKPEWAHRERVTSTSAPAQPNPRPPRGTAAPRAAIRRTPPAPLLLLAAVLLPVLASACSGAAGSAPPARQATETPAAATPSPDPTATPTPTPDPADAIRDPGPDLLALRDQLAVAISGYVGEYAISVLDLQTGEQIDVNGQRRQLAACTLKILIMIALAEDMSQGLYTPDDVADLVLPMMGPSYTAPARTLIARIGGGDIGTGIHRLNDLAARLGARQFLITHPPGYYWEEYGYRDLLGEDNNWMTTNDTNLVLQQLYQGKILPPEWTQYVLWSMTIGFYGPITDGVPAGATVYHKIGQLYQPHNVWNDAGIVVFRGDDGQDRAFAISFLGQYSRSTWESRANGAELTSMVYSFFNQRY